MRAFFAVLFTLIATYIQLLHVNEFNIGQYIPNIVLPILIFTQKRFNPKLHLIFFFIIGLMIDSMNPILFGNCTFSFVIAILVHKILNSHLELNLIANRVFLIFTVNVIFYAIYFINYSFSYGQFGLMLLLYFLIAILVNTLLSIFIITIFELLHNLKLDFNEI